MKICFCTGVLCFGDCNDDDENDHCDNCKSYSSFCSLLHGELMADLKID